jgi:hypothetical protein
MIYINIRGKSKMCGVGSALDIGHSGCEFGDCGGLMAQKAVRVYGLWVKPAIYAIAAS